MPAVFGMKICALDILVFSLPSCDMSHFLTATVSLRSLKENSTAHSGIEIYVCGVDIMCDEAEFVKKERAGCSQFRISGFVLTRRGHISVTTLL